MDCNARSAYQSYRRMIMSIGLTRDEYDSEIAEYEAKIQALLAACKVICRDELAVLSTDSIEQLNQAIAKVTT